MIGPHRWPAPAGGRIVFLDEFDVARARLRRPPHTIEHGLDVSRTRDTAARSDTSMRSTSVTMGGLVPDQARERAVFGRSRLLEQLPRRVLRHGFLISCASIAASAINERSATAMGELRSILVRHWCSPGA